MAHSHMFPIQPTPIPWTPQTSVSTSCEEVTDAVLLFTEISQESQNQPTLLWNLVSPHDWNIIAVYSLVVVIVYLMVLWSQCIIFISWFQFFWVAEDGPSFHICDVSHQPRCPSRASSFTSWTTFCECLRELVRLPEICDTFLIVTEESQAFYYCNIVLLRSSCVFMHVPNFLDNIQKKEVVPVFGKERGSDPIDEQLNEFLWLNYFEYWLKSSNFP